MDVKQKTSRVQTRLRSVVDLIVFLSSVCSSCGGGAQHDDRKCAIYRHSGAQAPLLELQIQSKITTWSFLVTFHGERVNARVHMPSPTHTHTDVDAHTCSGPKHPAAAYTNSSCVQTHVSRRQGVFRRKDAHLRVKPFVN